MRKGWWTLWSGWGGPIVDYLKVILFGVVAVSIWINLFIALVWLSVFWIKLWGIT